LHQQTKFYYRKIEGPPVALQLLAEFTLDKTILDRICFLIANHHSYHKINGTDFQILVESDFLVNIVEDEMQSHSIESIRRKYFKTATGISMINSMFCNSFQ